MPKLRFAMRNILLLTILSLVPLSAQAAPVLPTTPNEGLNSTVWVQQSTEARIASLQSYRLATMQLDAALNDPFWTAAVEQNAPFAHLPPAIILDLDETVLDNSPYQARAIRGGFDYEPKSWSAWINESNAKALPGSIGFLLYAKTRGVQIFYVSNRNQSEEAATRLNLERIGAPIQGPEDHLLFVGEQPDWTSDKSSRRRFVAANHRVLMLIGDDMNDFIAAKVPQVERLNLLNKYNAYWGERWILLANPMYGSWESAVYGTAAIRDERIKRKYEALDFGEGTTSTLAPVTTPPANAPSTGR